MNVVILGGSGFIGSHLRNKHLMMGDHVTIVDKNTYRGGNAVFPFDMHTIDLSNGNMVSALSNLFQTKLPNLVYNCVAVATPAYYVKHPVETFELDFEVNKRIIDFLDDIKIPFIHFSTSEVYGKKWDKPYTEESDYVLGPANKQRWIYATSKILLDQYILASNMNCCILRPFNFIGHDLDWLPDIDNAISVDKTWIPRVPSCFLNSLLTGKPMTIVNPGTQQRCYTHIDDAVNGIVSIYDNWSKCKGQILNIGNPNNETTINYLAEKMNYEWKTITGLDTIDPVYIDGVDLYGEGYEDSERRLFSNKKMKELTGWEAQIGLDETIHRTVKDAIEVYRP